MLFRINAAITDREVLMNTRRNTQTYSAGSDSQEGVSGCVPYVSERVHVDVVIVELFRESGAAGLCKQHTQPAAQILRAAGLMCMETHTHTRYLVSIKM